MHVLREVEEACVIMVKIKVWTEGRRTGLDKRREEIVRNQDTHTGKGCESG